MSTEEKSVDAAAILKKTIKSEMDRIKKINTDRIYELHN
jgi:hypothetical protein